MHFNRQSPPPMEEEAMEKTVLPLPCPSLWLSKFIKLQTDIFYTCLISVLSPFISFLSLFSESFRAEKTKESVESAVRAATKVPSTVVNGSSLLLKKVGIGLLAAVYVGVVLTVFLVLAFTLGIGMVQLWVEQPVILREGLHFDYTQLHPEAVFAFDGSHYSGFEGHYSHRHASRASVGGVPVGHTYYVSLVLLVPESDYNREIGVFQLTAELISSNGEILEKASYPCMLKFRSWPIRIVRTFVMGLPLLLGITAETQTIKVSMLKHIEDFPRTAAVRIILSPRAGTDFLPQLYEAELLLNSQLPLKKELVRRWKWTFSVWTSIYLYMMILLVALSCFRPLILPVLSTRSSGESEQNLAVEASEGTREKSREESDIPQSLRRRRYQGRSKRKAMHLQMEESQIPESAEESSATSISITRDDMGMSLDEDTGDSESGCYIG